MESGSQWTALIPVNRLLCFQSQCPLESSPLSSGSVLALADSLPAHLERWCRGPEGCHLFRLLSLPPGSASISSFAWDERPQWKNSSSHHPAGLHQDTLAVSCQPVPPNFRMWSALLQSQGTCRCPGNWWVSQTTPHSISLVGKAVLILPTGCEGTLFLVLKPSSHVHLSLTHQPQLCSLSLDVSYESTLVNPALLSRTPCFALGIHSRFWNLLGVGKWVPLFPDSSRFPSISLDWLMVWQTRQFPPRDVHVWILGNYKYVRSHEKEKFWLQMEWSLLKQSTWSLSWSRIGWVIPTTS